MGPGAISKATKGQCNAKGYKYTHTYAHLSLSLYVCVCMTLNMAAFCSILVMITFANKQFFIYVQQVKV